jgi:hypothetical protein
MAHDAQGQCRLIFVATHDVIGSCGCVHGVNEGLDVWSCVLYLKEHRCTDEDNDFMKQCCRCFTVLPTRLKTKFIVSKQVTQARANLLMT